MTPTHRITDEVIMAANADSGVVTALAACNTAKSECLAVETTVAGYTSSVGAPPSELTTRLTTVQDACNAAHAAWWTALMTKLAELAAGAETKPFLDNAGVPGSLDEVITSNGG